jgi:signal transduction histidine kinase
MAGSDEQQAVHRASAWKTRHDRLQARAYAAHQREIAAAGREEAAAVRDLAARIRADAALVRDDGARTRDDAARVRDSAARVRDLAAVARDLSTKSREESLRRRLRQGGLDKAGWDQVFELDRLSSSQAREASERDREAAELDRTAADKDRDAAERDRTAAARDREAADKDREASEKDRIASDADRAAADSDRRESERDLDLAEGHLDRTERLATLGSLAAGVAHEINNPLAAVLATLDSMETELKTPAGVAALPGLIHDARLAAERIGVVMTEMRAWLHAGADHPARQAIDLPKLIDDTLRLLGPKVSAVAKVTLDVHPVPHLSGVAPRLAQVLTNLLLNAARAVGGRPEDNEIHISTRVVDGHARLEVKDTGTGIPPDVLPHIFDPFFTTHEGSGGMGLGLAMCERIVMDHGGTLTVVTKVGQGSTFRVELPCGHEPRLRGSGPARVRHEKPHVLIIDDDVQFARSMKRLLATKCEVTVAVNGLEGLKAILDEAHDWDVVLCDLMMPVMNGLELYQKLHEVAPARAAELIFISGGATTSETADFLAKLPNVLLQKPFESAQLFQLIDARAAARR